MTNADPTPEQIEAYARAAALAVGLDVRDEDWPALLVNMRTIFTQAAVLLSDVTPDDEAPAPVFHP